VHHQHQRISAANTGNFVQLQLVSSFMLITTARVSYCSPFLMYVLFV
jgi:hypothetical protein